MKKFTFKGVLDGFRSTVQAQTRPDQEIQENLRPEHFQLKKTFRHGFPFAPTTMAFDPVQRLLAIGDKSGSLRILGRAGVDCHVTHPEGAGAVMHLHFLVNEGALVTATADDTLHLWNYRQKHPQIVQSLKFTRERITCLHLPLQSKWLHVGTEKGNIHVVQIESFQLSGYVINWNKAIEVLRKNHPGAVIDLSDNPLDASKLLIGYECGQIVLWDLRTKMAELRWSGADGLRSFSWHHEGKMFTCAHTDGSLVVWGVRPQPKPNTVTYPHAKTNKEGKLESCRAIQKVEWKTSKTGEPWVIFCGGLPSDRRTPGLSVQQGRGLTLLEMDSPVVDFITLCESPYPSDMQEPYAIVVLLQNDLVLIDLLSPGFPAFDVPHPLNVHESTVTVCSYLADCPSDLVPAFYSAGRSASQPRAEHSDKEWPISGGEWAPASCSYSEIIITGHADGSLKFWDASAGTLQVLYKLKTSKVFERCRNNRMEFDPLAIQLICLCPESRKLAVAGASGHVVLFKFKKSEANTETIALEIPNLSEPIKDEPEVSPDLEQPRRSDSTDSDKKEALKVRPGPQRKAPGFQALLACLPIGVSGQYPVTSLTLNSSYGLMAYGTEQGLVLVDIVHKICLMHVSAPELYGAQDPYSRAPRSPKKLDAPTSSQEAPQARSPSIDQTIVQALQFSPVPPTNAPSPYPSIQEATPTPTNPLELELAEDAYLSLTPTPTATPTPVPDSNKPPPGSEKDVDSEDNDDSSKVEVTQARRRSSTWKAFNLKRQLSKVDIKFKNTFSAPQNICSGSREKRGSVFYCSSAEATPLSPVEGTSPEENTEGRTSPDTDDSCHVQDELSCSKSPTKSLEDRPPCVDTRPSPRIADEPFESEADAVMRDLENIEREIFQDEMLSSSYKRVSIPEELPCTRTVVGSAEGARISRPDNLPLFDTDGRPVRPPRRVKKKHHEDKRDQRLLSVPNIKYKQEYKDLRSKDQAGSQQQASFAGNLMRRFSRVDKMDSSFSRSRSSSMSSLENISSETVQSLTFCECFIKKTESCCPVPTLWVGTSVGSVLIVTLNIPDGDTRRAQQATASIAGGGPFRLKGGIVTMSFLDYSGALQMAPSEPWRDEGKEKRDRTPTRSARMSPTLGEASCGGLTEQYAVLASEKQARVVALPSQTCLYRQQIADGEFVVKAEVIVLRELPCLISYLSSGHLTAHSLPSLRPLVDFDFLPLAELSFQTQCRQGGIVDPMLSIWGQQLIVNEDTDQIARTFCFSNRGHGLYLSSPTELQKFTVCAEFCAQLPEMMCELFAAADMPEPPKESFFKGLFGGGTRALDREELFGETSGKPNRSVARVVPGGSTAAVQDLGQRASTATSDVSRAHQLMLERGDKLSQLEDKAERMSNQAENFSSASHNLMLKYKDKKWYQL